MKKQSSSAKTQCINIPYPLHVNLSDDLRRYRELDLAINQGQKKTVEHLLQKNAPVKRNPTFDELRTPLHSSVYLGDLEIVKALLSKGASVNAGYAGDSPLTLAAKFKEYEITDLLLSVKGLENYSNSEGITHLHIACMRNQVDVAKKLLTSKQDVNASVHSLSYHWPGFTPLHFAAEFQCLETVEFLLRAGADITIKDVRSFTALHLANMYRNERIIDMILVAHKEVVSNPKNSKGLTHFHIACTRNNPKIVEHFLEQGEDPDSTVFPNTEGIAWHGKDTIDMAIHYECTDVVKLLLASRKDIHSHRSKELDRIKHAYCTGNMEMVHLLLNNSQVKEKSSPTERFTHSYLSALGGRILTLGEDISRFIIAALSKKPDLLNSSVVRTGCTPLHLAIEHGNAKVSEYLLGENVDYTIQNSQGKSPLHLAFERNMEKLVYLMLENHETFLRNPIDRDGISHLHIACMKNDAVTVEHLLKLDANIVNSPVISDAMVWAGFTPLHFTAKFGSADAAKILLKNGANYSARDALNLSPFDVALAEAVKTYEVGKFKILKLILNAQSQQKDVSFDDRGFTLLHLSSISPRITGNKIQRMKKILKDHPNDINKAVQPINCSWDGYTPLHFAVQRADADHAELLIQKGADILKQASDGDTPLHLTGHALSAVSLKRLKDEGSFADRLLRLNHIGTSGFSIFHRACFKGDLKLMEFFLKHGVDANLAMPAPGFGYGDGYKPLHLAVLNDSDSSVEAVKLLLDHGADPNAIDYQKNTPLHKMYNNGRPEIIDMLVNRGADVNALNAIYETPLICVCHQSNLDPEVLNVLIASFLDNGADINLKDNTNQTVLTLDDWYEHGEMDLSACSMIVDTLLTHVTKLKTVGFYVNEDNDFQCSIDKQYSTLLKDFARYLHFDKDSCAKQCMKELKLMKKIRIDQCTLYDILHYSPNNLAAISQNKDFQHVVQSNDPCEKFPMYGYILKLKLRQGQMRWSLVNESRKSFKFLVGVALPRFWVENTLQYLENEDLDNLIKSK